jgi:hypothetical protein
MSTKKLLFVVLTSFVAHTGHAQEETTQKQNYGKSVFSLSPFALTDISKGVGLSYERVLDKNGLFALWIPVTAGFSTYTSLMNNAIVNSNVVYGNLYATPGIKFYPKGCFHDVSYSIAPSVAVVFGSKQTSDYDQYGNAVLSSKDFMKLGFMATNTLNVNPTKHVYLGIDFGLGITYLSQVGGVNSNSGGLVYFGFRVGYRN